MTATPRTAAGRAHLTRLLAIIHGYDDAGPDCECADDILAIEAEATPSEGLRAALEAMFSSLDVKLPDGGVRVLSRHSAEVQAVRAALAAPATPPLDVERLARALTEAEYPGYRGDKKWERWSDNRAKAIAAAYERGEGTE